MSDAFPTLPPNSPKAYGLVLLAWREIRADGKITLAEWWKFSTVVFTVAVDSAALLKDQTGAAKLEWATTIAVDILLYVAPSLAGKVAGGTIAAIQWVGWTWPVIRAIVAGIIKGSIQTTYDKKVAELDAVAARARVVLLETQLAEAKKVLGEATGGLDA